MDAEGQGVWGACTPTTSSPDNLEILKPPLPSSCPAVPVEQLAKLGVLLGKNWQKALQVVDQNEVICYLAEPSGRKIFEVRSLTHTTNTAAAAVGLHRTDSRSTTMCNAGCRCTARAATISHCPRATVRAKHTTTKWWPSQRHPT